jgi:iron complex transport system substrate-binding protein
MRSLPRRLAATALAALTVTAVAACGSGDDQPAAGAAGPTAADAFPVTLDHKYGSTTIEAEPKRVVVVGLTEQDALLALGVVPVATTEWFGKQPGAIWPWAREALGSAAAPTVLSNVDGIQTEKIATLRPDLIVGLYSNLSRQDYDTLSRLAPVLAQPEGAVDFGVSWQDATRTVGKAVGRSARADELVTGAEAALTRAGAANPEFDGATGLVVTNYQGVFVYGDQDPRSRLLQSLGFRLPAGLAAVTGGEFGKNLSRERTDLLDVQALVWLVDKYGTAKSANDRNALYTALPVAEQGRDVYIEDGSELGSATSFVTVLSVPYLAAELTPLLKAAVDGDPSTTVPPTTAS